MTNSKSEPGIAGQRRYRAFMSYSHVDERAARTLHHWLETYRIPARLTGMPSPRGPVPRRLTPIFRDRAELPAASSLDQEVRLALSQSDALLLLCSPAAKASRWVDAEITLFRQLHPDRPIIAALVEGEPADSFPTALLTPDSHGIVHEPIAADFRPNHDGPKLARLKIIAGLTGLPLDQIIQRDAQRQLRRVIGVTFAAVFLALMMALMLVFVARARSEAEQQRQQAEGLIEFMLTDLREKLEGVGRLDVLQTVNKRALGYYAEQPDLNALPAASLERRARILQAMGEDDFKRGDTVAALAQFREAYRVTETLLTAAPDDPQRLFAHAQSEFWLGYVDFIRSRNDSALPRFEAYQALARRLVAIEPGNRAYWRELGYAQGNICTIAVDGKRTAQALKSCHEALETMERVRQLSPDDPNIAADLANRHAWMADALRIQGNNAAALDERNQQGDILQALLQADPKNAGYLQDWMLARYSMSQLLHALGQVKRAEDMQQEARADVNRLVAQDPDNNDWRVWQKKLARPLTQARN
ncbi:toll/interleukin-1 receptor domain-containing protein [Sphingobium sp. AP49]|uniref:toll/interleukin-1 receptor domain-containing protein n=1 Tax=Sphingobium sp. AP49 TaxID=1144307 RepID=UPI00026EE345|nr:toll/interleukin-1 receptor domain-containing protein [Sphingobium sp. AP49]WHO40140.1 toll/interleukin-1 receptor domain-containing protein [Sphingobium sp. AP49]